MVVILFVFVVVVFDVVAVVVVVVVVVDSLRNHSIFDDNQYIKLAYQEDSSWGIQFNLFADKLLRLNFIPESVYQLLDNWYIKVESE